MSGKRKELGFITLISIVISSQLGSGAFFLPAQLAPFKTVGLFGWLVSVAGAISLALVFSDLSSHLPKNGGPHVYVTEAFGRVAGFFTAWLYWIISWSSNSVLLVTALGYLTILTGKLGSFETFAIEAIILFSITYINIVGMKFSGKIEIFLTMFKILPLIFLPIVFFMFFDPSFFKISLKEGAQVGDVLTTISKTALLTFWGFIGVECATTPAQSVKNPQKTIPRAIIIGTSCVALVYLMNTVSITGVVGFEKLEGAAAPYAIVMNSIFANYSDVLISMLATIVCVGTLNAWTLTSGQIAYGAYEDGLFPKIFGKTNKSGAPKAALLIAAFGILPFLALEQFEQGGLGKLIDMLVSVFIFVYLVCCISYMKLIKKWYGANKKKKIRSQLLAQFSAIFCIFTLSQDLISSIIVLLIFISVGIPVFLKYKNTIKNTLIIED
ncbi:MAG: amino acid permease [Holosporales bacterium]|jgi:APA family basic amino acid/polyamine antiporter|nr:amino acid permease [Holosporales bacterium]